MNIYRKFKDNFSELSKSFLFRGTVWITISQGFTLIVQFSFFVLIARLLGSSNYGAFASIVALGGIIAPFSSAGMEILLIRDVARSKEEFGSSFGNALFMAIFPGLCLVLLLTLLSHTLFPPEISRLAFFCTVLSEIVFLKCIFVGHRAYVAFENFKAVGIIEFLLSFKNLIACLVFWAFSSNLSLISWTISYAVSTMLLAVFTIISVIENIGKPVFAYEKLLPNLHEGFYFSVDQSAYVVYNKVDKYMLASLSTLNASGIYAAAYRLIDVAFVPVKSLMTVSYSRFFKEGSNGISDGLTFAKKVVPAAIFYSLLAFAAVFIIAPFTPFILGNDFQEVPQALRWLAPMLVFRSVLYFGGDTLTGAGHQRIRTGIQMLFALLNVLLNFLLIPNFSWLGATWATLISEALLAGSLWSVAFYLHNKLVKSSTRQNE